MSDISYSLALNGTKINILTFNKIQDYPFFLKLIVSSKIYKSNYTNNYTFFDLL